MSLAALSGAFEAGEGRLRKDGLAQGGDALAPQAPSVGSGQRVVGRGETASALLSGSSRRIISRWAST